MLTPYLPNLGRVEIRGRNKAQRKERLTQSFNLVKTDLRIKHPDQGLTPRP